MKYCIDLNIPVVHPLADPSKLNQTGSKPEIWFADREDISIHYLKWLQDLGLTMTYPPLIFYTPPRRECGFHIDGSGIADRAVMNWIVGGTGSEMHWYSLTDEAAISSGMITQAGTPYTRYSEEDVVHLHSQAVGWPSLVQTGIPHKITNYVDEARWCISCDISRSSTPDLGLTMLEAMEIFSKWIK